MAPYRSCLYYSHYPFLFLVLLFRLSGTHTCTAQKDESTHTYPFRQTIPSPQRTRTDHCKTAYGRDLACVGDVGSSHPPPDPWSASCGMSSYCDKERFGLPRPRSSGVQSRYFISLPPYQRNQHQDIFILRHLLRLIQYVFQLWQEEIVDFHTHGLPGSSPDVLCGFLLSNCTHAQSHPLSKHSILLMHRVFLLWPKEDFRTQVPPEATFNASFHLSFSSATRINNWKRPRGPSSPQAPLCMASRLD